MPKFLKRKELWGSIIAIAILIFCFKDIKLDEVELLIERANLYYFIPALITEFLLIISKGVRWRVIVESHKKLPMVRTVFLYSAGQVLNIAMPALTGQIGRVLLFAKKADLTRTYVFSTVLVEVLFDAISLLLLILMLSMAFVFPAEYRSVSYIIAIVTVGLFVILYAMLNYKEKLGDLSRRRLRHRWPGLYLKLRKFSYSFTKGLSLLKSTKYFSRTLLLSLFGWLMHILAVYFLFYSFGFDLPFVTAMIIMVVNTLALMVPITPGNAGTFEIAVVAPLLAFGVAKSDAVLYALALHLADFIPIFIMGFFFLKIEKTSLKEIKEEGEKERILEEVAPDDLAADRNES